MSFDEHYRGVIENLFADDIPGFFEAKAFCLTGGKRLRPRLLLDAAHLWGAVSEEAMSVAVSIELLHQYLLVHDDLMDGDELRHDVPTVHAASGARYGQSAGNGIAVFVGDYLANEAMRILTNATTIEPQKRLALLHLTTERIRETILGQGSEYIPHLHWTIDELDRFYAYKTAAYSLSLPWSAASILAGNHPSRQERISTAARELGIAYQYHDDLIEFSGQKKRSAHGGGDLARGKITIVTRLLLDQLPEDIKSRICTQWSNGEELDEQQLGELRTFADTREIPSKIRARISKRIDNANEALGSLGLSQTSAVRDLLAFLKT